MFLNKCSIALDVGSKLTKVVFGKREENAISISGCGVCDIPCNLRSDLSCRQYIAESILNIIEKAKLKPQNVLIGINGQNVITRNIKLPNVRKKYLQQAAEYEFKKYLPLNTDEYIISQKINSVPDKDKRLDVLVVAVPKKIVNFYLNIVDMLGLPIKLIDIFANSLVEFFKTTIQQLNSVILLDIGHSHTEIVLIEDGRLYFQKVLGIGCSDIVSMDYDSFGLVHGAFLDDLVYNISSVIDFYISSRPGKRINSIYIHGGGSSIKGIKDYISSLINIETMLFDGNWCSVFDKNRLIDDYGIYVNCLSLLCKS